MADKKFKNKVKKKSRKQKSGRSKKYIILLSIISVIIVAAVLFWCYITQKPAGISDQQFIGFFDFNNGVQTQNNGEKPEQINDVKRKEDFYNFLVVGCDKKGLNTDVMMTVSYDVKNNTLAVVQMPRDSYVKLYEEHYSKSGRKLNSVFSLGYLKAKNSLPKLLKKVKNSNDKKELEKLCEQEYKDNGVVITAEDLKAYSDKKIKLDTLCTKNGMELLKRTMLTTFGLVSDYYAFMDLSGFKNIVDIIGGVELNVPSNMNYDDPYQNLHIHLKKGLQTLNGEKAEQFIRFRSGYYNADLGRIDAQKLFMTAFLDKMISTSTVTKLPELLAEVNKNVVTTIDLKDATYFAMNALSLDMQNIVMATMQGTPVQNGKYYSLYKSSNVKLVNDYFNVFNTDIPEDSVGIVELAEGKGNTVDVSTAKDIDSGDFKVPTAVQTSQSDHDLKDSQQEQYDTQAEDDQDENNSFVNDNNKENDKENDKDKNILSELKENGKSDESEQDNADNKDSESNKNGSKKDDESPKDDKESKENASQTDDENEKSNQTDNTSEDIKTDNKDNKEDKEDTQTSDYGGFGSIPPPPDEQEKEND